MAVQYGYAGEILRVDLSSGSISTMSTKGYAERRMIEQAQAVRVGKGACVNEEPGWRIW